MKIKTYDEEYLANRSYYTDSEHKWEFIRDLPGDNPEVLEDLDNHDMHNRLKEFGAYGKNDQPDPEMCCFYIYFKDKNAGRRFIKKLNEYLMQKAALIEKASSF